jgi:hypothetical protein
MLLLFLLLLLLMVMMMMLVGMAGLMMVMTRAGLLALSIGNIQLMYPVDQGILG